MDKLDTDATTCIAVGDPHFTTSNIVDAQALISKVNLLVDQLKPTFVVLLGDILHTHEKIHVTPLKLATEFITSLAKKVPVFVIIGNHDYCNNQQFLTDSHAFNAFKNIANVTVCDRPIVYEHAGNKFVYCPYTPPERFQEALCTLETEDKSWRDATCIFAHQEFYGCRFNPVATSTEGDIWPDDFPLVVSGHIHNEQRLQSNIYYTGSSMQHAFGENPNKTIALLTFKSGSKFKLQRIDLEMRKKKIVYINVETAETFKPDPNVYTKLVIKGTPEQFKVFRRGQVYKDLQAMGLAISFSPIDKDREATRDETRAVDKRGIMDILQDLIKDDNKYVKTAFEELNA